MTVEPNGFVQKLTSNQQMVGNLVVHNGLDKLCLPWLLTLMASISFGGLIHNQPTSKQVFLRNGTLCWLSVFDHVPPQFSSPEERIHFREQVNNPLLPWSCPGPAQWLRLCSFLLTFYKEANNHLEAAIALVKVPAHSKALNSP